MPKNLLAKVMRFYRRGGWRKQGIDQVAHLVYGAGLGLIPALLGAPAWLCAATTLITSTEREFVRQWPIKRWGDMILDVVIIAVGGALIGWWV